MSIKRLGPNKYQVRVNRVDPKTGLKVNRKLTVTGNKDDAQRAYAELQAEVQATAAKPSRIRLHAYAVSWLESRELRDTTRRRYAVSLGSILPVLGNYYLDSLTPEIIQQYVNNRRKQVEGYTVLADLRLLRTMAKDAFAARLCPVVFTDRVKAPSVNRYTRNNPNRMTPQQFIDTFAYLDPAWKPMTMLMSVPCEAVTASRGGAKRAVPWVKTMTVRRRC